MRLTNKQARQIADKQTKWFFHRWTPETSWWDNLMCGPPKERKHIRSEPMQVENHLVWCVLDWEGTEVYMRENGQEVGKCVGWCPSLNYDEIYQQLQRAEDSEEGRALDAVLTWLEEDDG